MKKYISLLITFSFSFLYGYAQIEGTKYYLPKTEMRFRLLIEKTSYTPGEYAAYSERFLKKTAREQTETSYNIVGLSMYTTAIPDSAKNFIVPVDKKHTIFNVELAPNGVLLAINTKGKTYEEPGFFKPSKKKSPLNPHDFMNEDILAAGSTTKMAELTARDIYDIRNSRNELTRGEADYMPKDGDQLKIMLANLDKQESILLQTFQGVTVKDTVEQEIVFCPTGTTKEGENNDDKQVLFRFSKKLGLVDADDLAGSPYYIVVEDLKIIPVIKTAVDGEKRPKDDPGITINMPGKIKTTIIDDNEPVKSFELYAAQYGSLESLSSNLFGKKMVTKLVLNPINGNVESLVTEPLE